MKVVKSLREEIYSIISDHILEDFEKHDNNNWTVEQITNEVIEKIEKRIDSINTTGMVPNDLPSIDPRVYKRGFYDGISYVEEMLKS